MASAVNPIVASTNNTAPVSSPAPAPPDKQMFLRMLVSQIQNQDPLNPVEGTQFVSQLAQFSELEQLIAIRTDMDKAQSTNQSAATANLAGTTGSPTAPGTNLSTPGSTHAESGAPVSQN